MDHAGEELERSAKLLHRPVARAYGQAGKVGIMQSRIFLRGYAREGKNAPFPCNPSPKTTATPKTKLGRLHRRLDTTSPSGDRGIYYVCMPSPLARQVRWN